MSSPAEDPYAPPATTLDGPTIAPVPAEWRRPAQRALLGFGVAVGVAVVGGVVSNVPHLLQDPAWILLGAALIGLLSLFACIRAVYALVLISRAGAPVPGPWKAGLVVFPLLGGAALALLGAFLTLWGLIGFARGRQLRRFGRVQLPPLADDTAWSAGTVAATAPADVRTELAARWRWNAQTEHASVAAFAQLTLDLLALGAPPTLVEAAQADARDEIRHAELCFGLARHLDGAATGPAPFPAARRLTRLPLGRTVALVQLAVDSLVDGVLHEGLSARVLARLVKRCEDPATREVLRTLAADEGRHAAHAWDVVEWCVAEGGASVVAALRGAIVALPDAIDDELPARARDGAWERFGIPGAALEAEEHRAACAQLVTRVGRLGTARAAA